MASIEERFSLALHNTARAWRQALDRRLKHLGIGQAAWLTIAAVARANKPLSQTDLANCLGVEAPTVVSMIDRLVKADLVRREPSEVDRRIKYIVLTDAGRDMFAQVRAEAERFRKELLQGADKAQLQTMAELLEALHVKADADRQPDPSVTNNKKTGGEGNHG